MTDLTPEQKKSEEDNELRLALLQSFAQFYGNLAGFLNKLNLNPTLKSYCFMNLDQGAMWAREAIAVLQFSPKPTVEIPSDENKNNIEEGVTL